MTCSLHKSLSKKWVRVNILDYLYANMSVFFDYYTSLGPTSNAHFQVIIMHAHFIVFVCVCVCELLRMNGSLSEI